MGIVKSDKIWMNGRWVAWDDAKIHVLSHAMHYASSVFEGIRCYTTPRGPAVFRLDEHIRRLLLSARIYRMELPFTGSWATQYPDKSRMEIESAFSASPRCLVSGLLSVSGRFFCIRPGLSLWKPSWHV